MENTIIAGYLPAPGETVPTSTAQILGLDYVKPFADNETIILAARFDLMDRGIIGRTGRKIPIETETGTIFVDEPEELHTFEAWKAAGFNVKKGQHAISRISIWKHTGPKNVSVPMEDGTQKEFEDKGHFFKKQACFFARSQVERIKVAAAS